jgi:large subunit ribosomal protein L13
VKTFSPKPRDIERRWYVIDADGAVLGRLASEVAKILRGKHKPIFAPHADTGDHVIVVNARGVRLTGGKEEKKIMYRHSGYPGGISGVKYGRVMAERPKLAVERAVKGMLPSNRLGRQMARKLSVYDGPDHPHKAQQPQTLSLGQIPRWEGLPKPKPAPVRTPAASDAKKKPAGRRVAAKTATPKSTAKRGTRAGARTTRPSTKKPKEEAAPMRTETRRRTPRPSKTEAGGAEKAEKKSRRSPRSKKTEDS